MKRTLNLHIGDLVFDGHDKRWGEVLLIGGEEKDAVITKENDDTIILLRPLSGGEDQTCASDIREIVPKKEWDILKAILSKDIFSVDKDGIHLFGYFYSTDDGGRKPFRLVEFTGAYLPLEKRADIAAKSEIEEDVKQYIDDMSPAEAWYTFRHYYDGAAPKPLPLCDADKAEDSVAYIDCESIPEI